jgi:hypothetical protein
MVWTKDHVDAYNYCCLHTHHKWQNHLNSASSPNQNMIHLQTNKNSSSKHKMKNNTKPCAKKLAWNTKNLQNK